MNRSSKFNFFLPQNTDPIDVSDFNSNFETIDANLLTKAQILTDAQKAAVRANVDLNVANNLTTTAAGSVLDARQGKVLGDSVSSLHQKYFSLDTAPDIPNNSNFNSLTTPGCYRVRSYSSATTMTNIPEITAGVLYVKNSMLEHGAVYRQQIYHTHQNNIYIRQSSDTGSTWTAWEQLQAGISGTWTPNIQRATVSSVVGKYQRIGKLYICTFSFSLDAVQTNAPYLNGSSLPGYTSSVFTAAEGSWSSTADEFGAMGNTNNNNIWCSKNNAIYGMSGSVNKTVRGALTYIV